ncbi:MAG: hypothetical protein LQ338_005112 [Usnochroma carphineum]|nr:MAG: hypothetical protein LQ338_005112 [Usnochroma carphineum]
MGPDTRQIAEHIDAGRIPLVRLSVKNGEPTLDVVTADIDTRYLSVSHVWIGGLGNFKDNKLPKCQLSRLYELLNELNLFQPREPSVEFFQSGLLTRLYGLLDMTLSRLSSIGQSIIPWHQYYRLTPHGSPGHHTTHQQPITFWMDTLCIPVDPLLKPLRLKAIDNMALTYAAAEKCLVLDPELCQISMRGLSNTQINAHVLCSSWVRRSWTFQEARLSRVWYAQFADGLWNPNSIENAALEHRLYSRWNVEKSDEHQLASDTIMWYHDMPASRQMDIIKNKNQRELLHYPQYNFEIGWNNLMSRSTSKPEDVHGIFANTLDLSAGEVLALPLQDRMKAILGTQETFSAGVVYSRGRKTQDLSNRWVPMFPSGSYLSPTYGHMERVNGGFLLNEANGNPVGFLVEKSAPRYSQLRIIESSGTVRPLWINIYTEDNGPPVEFEAPGDILAVCYVVGDLKQSLEHNPVTRRMQGARFALRRIEGQTLHLVYEYSFTYTHQSRSLRDDEHQYPAVHAERTADDAVFQIDCDFTSWPTLSYRRDTSSEHSMHGLYFYVPFWLPFIALIWAPFYYISVLSSHPRDLLMPTIVFVMRALVGLLEAMKTQKRVNEHAYKAWVKTFDESGCLKKRDTGRENHEGYEIGTRVKMVWIGSAVRGSGEMGIGEDVVEDEGKALG